MFQIEFDPPSNPEMATGAEIIGTAIYHAIGYNVVENYLVEIDLDQLSIDPKATITINGRSRPFTPRFAVDPAPRRAEAKRSLSRQSEPVCRRPIPRAVPVLRDASG